MATTTNPPRELRTAKGVRVVTAMTDDEAAAKLKGVDNPFARKLLAKRRQYGSWSNDQTAWVHKLVTEAGLAPKVEGVPDSLGTVPVSKDGVADVLSVLENAKLFSKHPKIDVLVNGVSLALAVAGDKAKHPGTVNVTDGGRWGNNQWYGRLWADGRFETASVCTPEVVEAVKVVLADPEGAAEKYAKPTA